MIPKMGSREKEAGGNTGETEDAIRPIVTENKKISRARKKETSSGKMQDQRQTE